MEKAIEYIITFVCGGTAIKLLELFFQRKDKKEDKNNELLQAINEIKADVSQVKNDMQLQKQNQLRTEMLVMMNHYENETFEIMRLAHKYFVEEGGDFTMTSIFSQFLKDHNIEKPLWFDETK
ncbi:MAG: hypothetical protein KBT03_02830 [Bacteroidales bacterium]|nr:hypothetical protein [Candidatus Scybalousia scybalohippi]